MGTIYLNWSRTNDYDQSAPDTQTFDETQNGARIPLQTLPEANVIVQNTVPGRSYRIKELVSSNVGGVNWSIGMSSNAYRETYYWPVSNLDTTPYTRDALVSNVNVYPHHSRVSANTYALRLVTRPPSVDLASVDDTMSFGLFLESNIDPLTTVTVGLDDSNLFTFDPLPQFVELGYDYEFDNSNNHLNFQLQLIDQNQNVLVNSDSNGILRFNLENQALVGTDIYAVQTTNAETNASSPMTVRDGRNKRFYNELGNLSFAELFSNGFRTYVFEANVDPSYVKYDAFLTMRNSNDLYVTSHMYQHTVEMKTYPPPSSIDIYDLRKTPSEGVRFEYQNDYTVGLRFRLVRDVSLRDMYQRILYG
jgi:hypothetical protein